MFTSLRARKGFTLIELLIVVVILVTAEEAFFSDSTY
jgi:prepilin-type N-terminal cleavage/methylation domain-containing protein